MISYTFKLSSIVSVWKNPVWTIFEFFKGTEIGFGGRMGAAIALLIFGAGFLSFVRTNAVVVQLLVIPSLVCAAAVIGIGHHLWPRFFIFTMGFAALVIVRGTMIVGNLVARLLYHESKNAIPLGSILCVGLICVSAVSAAFAYGPKQDYQGALAFVQANRHQGDAVVTPGLAYIPYHNLYKTDWRRVDNLQALESIRSAAKRTWLVYTLPFPLRVRFPEIMASIERDFKVVKQFPGTLSGGTIYVCRSDTPPPLNKTASKQ
jgi:hypothetical protein